VANIATPHFVFTVSILSLKGVCSHPVTKAEANSSLDLLLFNGS